ncbi:MAG: gamma-glutamylcyclotransferase [Scytolyngbya sp. HA4215-MV1]|jgi:gamma-glutamylcyclotransferase (GGCT)/AIG2-like uncharacterized protein YtfP|nr:gamma-glutamylcyclotransferase [Scytolyngbya sp. HA4215-MV1]
MSPINEKFTQVFVYGTLKPGEMNDWVVRDQVVSARPAIAFGQLFSLSLGYPAMAIGSDPIQGVLLSFRDERILLTLDTFEQHDPQEFAYHAPGQILHQNQYQRHPIAVFSPSHHPLGIAWAYLMTLEQINRLGGRFLPDGQWLS